jgi:hypothetical protein
MSLGVSLNCRRRGDQDKLPCALFVSFDMLARQARVRDDAMDSTTNTGRFTSFAEFWPFYVQEHSRPATRVVHFLGSTLAVVLVIVAIVGQWWWLLLAVPLVGYGFAWASHFGIEHNRPATFKYPLWSLAADWKMWLLMLSGQMGKEVERVRELAGARRTVP